MKPITWIQLFILCAGIGQAWAVKAQDVRFLSQEKIDSLINPPLMKQGDEILRFEKTVTGVKTGSAHITVKVSNGTEQTITVTVRKKANDNGWM